MHLKAENCIFSNISVEILDLEKYINNPYSIIERTKLLYSVNKVIGGEPHQVPHRNLMIFKVLWFFFGHN